MPPRYCSDATLPERFARYIDPRGPDACWPWVGSIRWSNNGTSFSGQIGTSQGSELAHRVAYRLHHGLSFEALKGCRIGHTCGNRLCCNPRHLVLQPRQPENFRKLSPREAARRGETHPRARLTDTIVRAIRRDPRSQYEIGRQYGIGQSHVSMIKRNNIWTHVE